MASAISASCQSMTNSAPITIVIVTTFWERKIRP